MIVTIHARASTVGQDPDNQAVGFRVDVLSDGRMVGQAPWRADTAKVAMLLEKTGSRQGYKGDVEKRASEKTAVLSDDAEAAL